METNSFTYPARKTIKNQFFTVVTESSVCCPQQKIRAHELIGDNNSRSSPVLEFLDISSFCRKFNKTHLFSSVGKYQPSACSSLQHQECFLSENRAC